MIEGLSPSSRLIRDIIKLGADFLSLNNKKFKLIRFLITSLESITCRCFR